MRRVEVIMAERRASALAAAAVWLVVLAALVFVLVGVMAPVSRVELELGPPVTPATASPPVPYQKEASDD